MIRKVALFAALCAVAVGLMAASASATTITCGSGVVCPTGTEIGTTSGTDGVTSSKLTMTTGQSISCSTGGFAGTMGANGGATVTGTLTSGTNGLSFTTCTGNIPGITNCHQTTNLSGSVSAVSATGGGNITVGVDVTCTDAFGNAVCTYHSGTSSTGTVTGTFSNSTHELTFSNVAVVYVSGIGSASCGVDGNFSAVFGPIEVLSSPNTGQFVTID